MRIQSLLVVLEVHWKSRLSEFTIMGLSKESHQ
jgi:hypothetical protein